MILPIEILLLILVVALAFISLWIRDLISAVVVFGAYSFLMCLIWTGMGAVDVAFTEAAVGAGVSTVFFIAILFNTTRRIQFNPLDLSSKIFASLGRHGPPTPGLGTGILSLTYPLLAAETKLFISNPKSLQIRARVICRNRSID